MAEDNKTKDGEAGGSGGSRAQRQAKALRENLRRRKDQARQRRAAGADAPPNRGGEQG